MTNKEKISFAINQIPINNCDGSANIDSIKAIRYLQEVHKALNQQDIVGRSEQLADFERWAKLNAKNVHDIDYWISEYRYQKSNNSK